MPTPTAVRAFIRPEEVLRSAGIRAGWKVVDFGCGPGYYLVPAARFVGKQGRVVGIDILAAAVDQARKRVQSAAVETWTDVFRLDLTRPAASGLPDDWADLVLMSSVLSQSAPVPIVREAARVVKPSDGRVVVIEWDQVATPLGPPPEQRVDETVVLAAAKQAGLTLLSTFRPSPHHYGLTLVKPLAEDGGTESRAHRRAPRRRAGHVRTPRP